MGGDLVVARRGDLLLAQVARAGLPAEWADMTQAQRDAWMPPEAVELIRRGIADNTWQAYQRAWRKFDRWGFHTQRTVLPVTEQTMLAYLVHLGGVAKPPSPSAVWIWYSAVRFVHAMSTPPVPWECGKKLFEAIDGYVKTRIEAGYRVKEAPRAYPQHVRDMVDQCDRSTLVGRRDASILLTGFHTAARASHLGIYRIGDVKQVPGGLDFYLAFSKTDQKGDGFTFGVPANDEHPQWCGVRATRAWLEDLAQLGFRAGALYRPINRNGNLLASSAELAYRMSGTAITNVVHRYAKAAGYSADMTMHSFRRGRATQQRELGADSVSIARQYDWNPGSSSFLRYIKEAERWAEESLTRTGLL